MPDRRTVKKFKALSQEIFGTLRAPSRSSDPDDRDRGFDEPEQINLATVPPVPSLSLPRRDIDAIRGVDTPDIDLPSDPIQELYFPPSSYESNSADLSSCIKTFISRYNLPKSALDSLTGILRSTAEVSRADTDLVIPSSNSLIPKNSKFILESHELCTACDKPLVSDFCEFCRKKPEAIGYLSVGNLSAQFLELFCVEIFIGLIRRTKDSIRQGAYASSEIYSGSLYTEIFPFLGDLDITVSLNTDGVDIFDSSNKSVWPIFLTINEIPYPERFTIKYTVLAGVYFSKKKIFKHGKYPEFDF